MTNYLNENYIIAFAFFASLIISLVSIPSIIKVAELKNLFDEPDSRKVHQNSVPTLGGLAIFSGFAVSSLFFCNIVEIPELKFFIAGTIILFFIGIKDDILMIAPITKLLGQIIVTFIIVFFSDIELTNVHGFLGINEIPRYVGIPLTIFVFLVVINGFNLIDGIDGLSSSIGVVSAGTLGLWFYLVGEYQYTIIAVSISGALIGFLRYNVLSKTNKIFMGDTGSLIIGLVVSILIIKFNEMNITKNFEYSKYGAPAISIAILVIPLFDTLRVMFIRFWQRKPLFQPDKQHIHHTFIDLGLSHRQAVLIIVIINILFISAAMVLQNQMGIRRLTLLLLLSAMITFQIPIWLKNKKKK